ncbi:MAG: hypothetical protein ACREDF_08920, partial [Thermoplasmata archaeon]
RWWVLWMDKGSKALQSKEFNTPDEARKYQAEIAGSGKRSSIIVRKVGRRWDCRHPVRGVIATRKGGVPVAVHPPTAKMKRLKVRDEKAIRRMEGVAIGADTRTYGDGGGRGDDFDTQDEMALQRESTTDHPTAAWAKQARSGPYYAVQKMYDDTPSSHMYQAVLPPLDPIPGRFGAGVRFRNR